MIVFLSKFSVFSKQILFHALVWRGSANILQIAFFQSNCSKKTKYCIFHNFELLINLSWGKSCTSIKREMFFGEEGRGLFVRRIVFILTTEDKSLPKDRLTAAPYYAIVTHNMYCIQYKYKYTIQILRNNANTIHNTNINTQYKYKYTNTHKYTRTIWLVCFVMQLSLMTHNRYCTQYIMHTKNLSLTIL